MASYGGSGSQSPVADSRVCLVAFVRPGTLVRVGTAARPGTRVPPGTAARPGTPVPPGTAARPGTRVHPVVLLPKRPALRSRSVFSAWQAWQRDFMFAYDVGPRLATGSSWSYSRP